MLNSYHILTILFILLAAYSVSYFMVKTKKISLILHKMIWNYLLLINFVLSGLIGLILAFLIDYKYSIVWYRQALWIHVEFGIAMAVVAIFHLIWHFGYYRAILRLDRTDKER